jgi:hypothetical protein
MQLPEHFLWRGGSRVWLPLLARRICTGRNHWIFYVRNTHWTIIVIAEQRSEQKNMNTEHCLLQATF